MAPTQPWQEPTARIPLRWGTYRERYAFGILLIVGGAIQLQGSNTWTLPMLLIGTVAHVTGWLVLPARGWRRIVAAVLGTIQIWLMLTGPFSMWLLVLPFIGWMLVRHRPALSYLTVPLPVLGGIMVAQIFSEYSEMLLAIGVSMAVFVGSAWLARTLAALRFSSRIR